VELLSSKVLLYSFILVALKARDMVKESAATVIDIFSIKPIDEATIYACAKESKGKIITVEDHYKEGGIFGITIVYNCLCRCGVCSNG